MTSSSRRVLNRREKVPYESAHSVSSPVGTHAQTPQNRMDQVQPLSHLGPGLQATESGVGSGYKATLPLGLQATESGVGSGYIATLLLGLQATESGVGSVYKATSSLGLQATESSGNTSVL